MSTPMHSRLGTEGRLAYVDALVLPESPIRSGEADPPPPNLRQDGFVSDASLVSFDTTMTEEHKSDVLHSELLAQLGATAAHDPRKEPMEWYKKYGEILQNIAWVVQASEWRPYETHSDSFGIDKVMIDILKAVVQGDGLAIAEATFAALKETGEDSRQVSIFEDNASTGGDANFRAFPCYPTDMGVAISFSGYQMKTSTSVTSFLWWTFKSSDTKIDTAASTYVLDEEVYTPLRPAILKKLGIRANEYIAGLDI
jgi:hypothetical protein